MNSLVICGLDTETTGLLSPDHRLIEVYAGLWKNGKEVYRLDQRIDPQRGIAADAQKVHGISYGDLVGQPTWDVVAPKVQVVLSKCHLVVGHNIAEFDWPFLEQEFRRIGLALPKVPIFDTMLDGVWATPHGKKPRLEELCFACDVEYDPAKSHAASYDVTVMMDCFFKGLEWGFYELPEALRASQPAAA